MIPTIKLRSGVEMPAIGLGTWQLYEEKCENAIKIALELGYNHIDTAQIYENEFFVGRALEGRRDQVFLTTKVFHNNLHYDDMFASALSSAHKLRTRTFDLLLAHWPNKNIPLQETLTAFRDLKKMGITKSVGVSNYTIAHLKEAINLGIVDIEVNQVEFHPLLYQKELLEFCKQNNIVLTAYSPLARGKVFNNTIIKAIATKHGKTPGQISLRWLFEKGVVTIPKATSKEHLKENMDIFDFSLDEEDTRKLDNLPQERIINPPFAEYELE